MDEDKERLFGAWLRRRRQLLGLTQKALAKQVQYSIGHYRKVEAGDRRPVRQLVDRLADALHVPPKYRSAFVAFACWEGPPPFPPEANLWPVGSSPLRVYSNLPAPTYSQLVMRAQAFADVCDGLRQRSAVVQIVGLGGSGKTSLAREIAGCCLQPDGGTPQFDAVVWVSDKDRPGTTNLSIVLDEIAHTLDYPGFAEFEHEEKRREVEQLLRRQRVLVVVDNFETITDGALLAWLLRLPEPSKVLITSREYTRAFRNNTFVLELHGMNENETSKFVEQRLRFLRLEQMVGDQAQFEPLMVATGGNPLAIELTLGLVKYERRPLQQVVNDLYAARGKLFDDLFSRAWALLDEATRQVLLVLTFFPASASGAAISATADVQGFAFERAIERLTDLALLDVQQENLNSAPRYALHPLVRSFVKARLKEQLGFEHQARDRWITWCIGLTSKLKNCYEPDKLELLNPEHETVYSAIEWAIKERRYDKALEIIVSSEYYFFYKGYWTRKLNINNWYFEAAKELSDSIAMLKATAYQAQLLSRQDNTPEAEKLLLELKELARAMSLPADALFDYMSTIAVYRMNLPAPDFSGAQQAWQEVLDHPGELPKRISIACRRWIGHCLYHQGKEKGKEKFTEAREILHEALQDATRNSDQRAAAFIRIRLAAIDLECGDLESAAQNLAESSTKLQRFYGRRDWAEQQFVYGRLYKAQYKHDKLHYRIHDARNALGEAIDLFTRLGMRRELAEARAELDELGDL